MPGAPGVALDGIFEVYERDNASAWDCDANGKYALREPADGDQRRAAQEVFIRRAADEPVPPRAHAETPEPVTDR